VDQKNIILAIALSLAILLGWQYFIVGPQVEEQRALEAARQAQQAEQQAVGDTGSVPRPSAPGAAPGGISAPSSIVPAAQAREEALAQGIRIPIETDAVRGTINLVGGRIDDLVLHRYHQTLEPDSPDIVLLSPRDSANPYFADFGWVDNNGNVYGTGDTPWRTASTKLTTDTPLVLTWDNGSGIRLTRTYAIDDNYMITVTQRVENTGDAAIDLFPFGRLTRIGTPKTLGFYVLHEGPIGVFDDSLTEVDYDDLQESKPETFETTGGWLGYTDRYWLAALVPNQGEPVKASLSHRLSPRGEDVYQADYLGSGHRIAPGGSTEIDNRLFAGAKVFKLLEHYRDDLNIPKFALAIDFGWFFFLTKPLMRALLWLQGMIGNLGLAILVVTIVIKLAFFPLANKSYKSMTRMKALQPKMTELREKFGDDKQKMQQELMAMYKREKVNPVSGCLPMLIQIPVFFALYKVIFISIEMRHAPFFGWIQDLSAPDPTTVWNLFGLIPWDPATIIPAFLMIGVWPLAMGVTMFLQMKLNPAPADPVQAKIFTFMPLAFTFFLAQFPAGLVIYWTWNNILSMAQQYVIMRRMGVGIGGESTAHTST
jgi:YidC/Oxa1 family membrane protein insertase